jgi:hypothetical protein
MKAEIHIEAKQKQNESGRGFSELSPPENQLQNASRETMHA